MDFSTRFDPKEVELRLYERWEQKALFRADPRSGREPFAVVIPPPNVTGSLHIGHALNNTLQDVVIRWKRMAGCEALLLPGTDHAGIATQVVVEKELRKAEGKTKHDIGREEFLKRVWAWKEKFGHTILYQLKRLGCSCDWSRTRFTMDDEYSRAVRTVFVSLFNKGLVYRGLFVVNWCPKCLTALSDLEVVRPEPPPPGTLWHIRYPLRDESGKYVVVATTRPETMLGDTAVAVHPDDARYRNLIGRRVALPFVDRDIPIIADSFVDSAFGTGAVKVTPAHDMNDFECARRHGLPAIVAMDPRGTMNENAGPFRGLERFEARDRVIAGLRDKGLLEKEQEYPTPVGRCYRCDTIIEPRLSEQWFVRTKPLAEPAVEAVRRGEVRYVPSRWAKVYFDWMENIRDWCISRQLWWGHRIPVWYCPCGEVVAAVTDPASCPKCGGNRLRQDDDVLDTWFSSALWPFATLGWPEESEDLQRFFPTQVLVTARDIINLWVARMIMMGLEFRGEKPFSDVIIHATILDDQGQRMSKSKGTGVDPLELLDRYGADALRFALVKLSTGTQDFRFGRNLSVRRTEEGRNFVTKLWNACRFVAAQGNAAPSAPPSEQLAVEDRWILSRLNRVIQAVTKALEAYEFSRAADVLYGFVWDEFCDWYIEFAKRRGDDETARRVLRHVVHVTLRLLHPVCPFVTEEIWQRLFGEGFVAVATWPEADPERIDDAVELRMGIVFEAVKGVRAVRAHYGIAPSVKLAAKASVKDSAALSNLAGAAADLIVHLGNLRSFEAGVGLEVPPGASRSTGPELTLFVQVAGTFDREKELERSRKELANLEAQRGRLIRQLENEAFRRAKPEMAAEMEETLGRTGEKIHDVDEHIRELQGM